MTLSRLMISESISNDILPQMKILSTVIPLVFCYIDFIQISKIKPCV